MKLEPEPTVPGMKEPEPLNYVGSLLFGTALEAVGYWLWYRVPNVFCFLILALHRSSSEWSECCNPQALLTVKSLNLCH